jgi:hypothetical protein
VDPATNTTSFSWEALAADPDALATDPVADAFIDAASIK